MRDIHHSLLVQDSMEGYLADISHIVKCCMLWDYIFLCIFLYNRWYFPWFAVYSVGCSFQLLYNVATAPVVFLTFCCFWVHTRGVRFIIGPSPPSRGFHRCYGLFLSLGSCLPHLFIVHETRDFNPFVTFTCHPPILLSTEVYLFINSSFDSPLTEERGHRFRGDTCIRFCTASHRLRLAAHHDFTNTIL